MVRSLKMPVQAEWLHRQRQHFCPPLTLRSSRSACFIRLAYPAAPPSLMHPFSRTPRHARSQLTNGPAARGELDE